MSSTQQVYLMIFELGWFQALFCVETDSHSRSWFLGNLGSSGSLQKVIHTASQLFYPREVSFQEFQASLYGPNQVSFYDDFKKEV